MQPSRISYDSDLTDAEWEQLAPLVLPPAKPDGCPLKQSRREILNGIFYAVRSGSAWKLLPHGLPPWRRVYHYFWSWRRTGVWQQIHDTLRERVREGAGRNTNPSAAILDSQSVRTSEAGAYVGATAADDGVPDLYLDDPSDDTPTGRIMKLFRLALNPLGRWQRCGLWARHS